MKPYTNIKKVAMASDPLADPGWGGGHTARAPLNGRGPMIFYAQNAIFPQYFFLTFFPTTFTAEF